jgi:hypothetical protein
MQAFENYAHASPKSSMYMDLEHANAGKTQTVQLFLGGSSVIIQVFIVNFDSSKTISYTFTGSSSASSDSSYCIQGTPMSNSIYCSSCYSPAYIGAFCNITDISIQVGVTYLLQLKQYGDPSNFVPFTIPGSTNKLVLHYAANDVGVTNFIQFKQRSDEYAGWMNYVANGGQNSITRTATEYTISISSSGNDVAVAFWNPNANSVSLTVWYTEDSSSNVLLIVLAVLGGVLFILLVIVAVYIVRRMNSNANRQVQPGSPLRRASIARQTENTLSAQEIEIYFPTVLCKNVFNS